LGGRLFGQDKGAGFAFVLLGDPVHEIAELDPATAFGVHQGGQGRTVHSDLRSLRRGDLPLSPPSLCRHALANVAII
jgi:hypothetical protein